jgi:hypothetical protein
MPTPSTEQVGGCTGSAPNQNKKQKDKKKNMKTMFISALAFASLSTLAAGTSHPGSQSAPRAAAQPHVNPARPIQPARSAATNRPYTVQPGATRYNSQRPNVGQTNSAHAANSVRPNAAHVNSARPNSGQLGAQRSANTSEPKPAQTNAARSNPSHSNSAAQHNNASNGWTHPTLDKPGMPTIRL